MSDPLTTKDVLKVVIDTERLLSNLIPRIDWNIKGGAENSFNFDLKVQAETCYDGLALIRENADEWVT